MALISEIHRRYVFGRRIRVLAERLSCLIPKKARVLDIGCGDGNLTAAIKARRVDIEVVGIDVLLRPDTGLPVIPFDGEHVPFTENAFDVVLLVDVLHHTDNPVELLKEARRVADNTVILKDHSCNGLAAGLTLRLMDWVGNARYGVALPYNYLSQQSWAKAFHQSQLQVDKLFNQLHLFPWPFTLLFNRRLHFIARLHPTACPDAASTVGDC